MSINAPRLSAGAQDATTKRSALGIISLTVALLADLCFITFKLLADRLPTGSAHAWNSPHDAMFITGPVISLFITPVGIIIGLIALFRRRRRIDLLGLIGLVSNILLLLISVLLILNWLMWAAMAGMSAVR